MPLSPHSFYRNIGALQGQPDWNEEAVIKELRWASAVMWEDSDQTVESGKLMPIPMPSKEAWAFVECIGDLPHKERQALTRKFPHPNDLTHKLKEIETEVTRSPSMASPNEQQEVDHARALIEPAVLPLPDSIIVAAHMGDFDEFTTSDIARILRPIGVETRRLTTALKQLANAKQPLIERVSDEMVFRATGLGRQRYQALLKLRA